MRPKFVFGLLVFTFLVLGGAVLLKQHLGSGSKPSANFGSVAPQVHSNVVAVAAPRLEPEPAPFPVAPFPTNAVTPPTNTAPPVQSQEAIDAELNHLQEWSMNDDRASLSNILGDLTNSDKDIREAAIDAVREYGSTNAIPALKAAAEMTDDLQEKIAYLEAAQFLSIPPLEFNGPVVPPSPEQIQLAKQRTAELEARQQAQLQQKFHNHGAPTPSGQNPPTTPNNQ